MSPFCTDAEGVADGTGVVMDTAVGEQGALHAGLIKGRAPTPWEGAAIHDASPHIREVMSKLMVGVEQILEARLLNRKNATWQLGDIDLENIPFFSDVFARLREVFNDTVEDVQFTVSCAGFRVILIFIYQAFQSLQIKAVELSNCLATNRLSEF